MSAHAGPHAVLESWLLALDGNRHRQQIEPDLDLIDDEVIDSLEFVNFLLVIEDLRGAPIPADEIRIEAFRSLRSITERFLSPGGRAEGEGR